MSFFDAYVGPLEQYTTVSSALNDGKYNICVVGNTNESDQWNVPGGEASVTIRPDAVVYFHGTSDFIVSEEFMPTFFFSVVGGTIIYESSGKLTNTSTFEGSLVKLDYITINSTRAQVEVSSENIVLNECSLNLNTLDLTLSHNVTLTGNTCVGNITSKSISNVVTFQNNIIYGSIILENNPEMIRIKSNTIGFLNIYGNIDNLIVTSNIISFLVSDDMTIKNSVISMNTINMWDLRANLDMCTISTNIINSNVYIHDVTDSYINDNSMLETYIGSDAIGIPSISRSSITGNTLTLLYINSGTNDSNLISDNILASIIIEGEVIDLTIRNNVCNLIELRGNVKDSHMENNNTDVITILGLMDTSVITEEKYSKITLKDVNRSSILNNFGCKFLCNYFKRSSFALNYSNIAMDKCKYGQLVHNNSNININHANRSIIQSNIGKIKIRSCNKSIIDSNITVGC